MSATGGSVKEWSLRGRSMKADGEADVKMTLGGYSNEAKANGDLSARQIKTAMLPSVEGLVTEIDHEKDDLSFLQEVADGGAFEPFTITYVDGTTFQGKAQLVGDLPAYGSKEATCEVKLAFTGKITPQ